MRRRSTVSYIAKAEGKEDEVVHESIWVQNLEANNIQGNSVVLKLFRDENGNPVMTPNNDEVMQYQASLPIQGGAFAYISVNAMKALIALKAVRELGDEQWIELQLDPVQPSLRDFRQGKPVEAI